MERFTFMVPADAVGPITVSAELNYWAFPQKLVDFLLGPDTLQVEITQIAATSGQVPLSTDPSAAMK